MKRKRYANDILMNGLVEGVGLLAGVGAACVIGAACRGVPLATIPKVLRFTVPYGIGGLAGMAGKGAKSYARSVGKDVLEFSDVVSGAIEDKVQEIKGNSETDAES